MKLDAAALKYDERHSEEQLAWLQLERARLRYEAEVDDTDDDDDEDDADDSDDECHEHPRRQGQTDEARDRDTDHPRRRDPLDDLNVSLRDPSISSAATATGERHRRRDPLDAPSVSLRDPSMCSAATTTSERVERACEMSRATLRNPDSELRRNPSENARDVEWIEIESSHQQSVWGYSRWRATRASKRTR